MPEKIFLSFASEQRQQAENIALALRGRGYSVFFSHDDLPPGSSFDDRIERAIAASDLLLFLVSPESVTRGRYTLTELAFARAKWPNPSGRVLPVMLQEIPLDTLPGYLKAVTLLQPEGNVAAETSAAVSKLMQMQSTVTLAKLRPFLAIAAASIVLCYGAYSLVPNALKFSFVFSLNPSLASPGAVTTLPGLVFGSALAACHHLFGLKDRFHLVLIVLVTSLAWVAAYDATVSTGNLLGAYKKPIDIALAGTPQPSSGEQDSSERDEHLPKEEALPSLPYLIGLVGGAVGGGLTLFGLLIVNPALRRFDQVMLIWVTATLTGASLGLVPTLGERAGFFILYLVWQGTFIGMLVRADLQSKRAQPA